MSHTEWTLHYTPSQRAAELLDGALRSFQVQLGLLAFSEEMKEAGPCMLPTFPPHLFTCCWHQCSSTTAWGQTAAPSCTLWSLAPAALSQDQLPAPRTQPRCPQPNRDLGRDELRSQSLLSCYTPGCHSSLSSDSRLCSPTGQQQGLSDGSHSRMCGWPHWHWRNLGDRLLRDTSTLQGHASWFIKSKSLPQSLCRQLTSL